MFDAKAHVNYDRCNCCFNCIKLHSKDGCTKCSNFLIQFFPVKSNLKRKKSVYTELKNALHELFQVLNISSLRVESELNLECKSFVKDFLRVVDEIRCCDDIVKFWHIDADVAARVYSVLECVISSEFCVASTEYESEKESSSESEKEISSDLSSASSESSDNESESSYSSESFDSCSAVEEF